jgi:hypothetical protein
MTYINFSNFKKSKNGRFIWVKRHMQRSHLANQAVEQDVNIILQSIPSAFKFYEKLSFEHISPGSMGMILTSDKIRELVIGGVPPFHTLAE